MIKLKENESFKSMWNKKLDPEEHKKVLIKAIITAILVAIIAGFINYLLLYHNSNILGAILINGLFIGAIINKGIEKYHIRYSFLSVLLTLGSIILSNALTFIFFNAFTLKFGLGDILSSANFYKFTFIYPIHLLINAFKYNATSNYVYALLAIILHSASFLLAYFLPKFRKED